MRGARLQHTRAVAAGLEMQRALPPLPAPGRALELICIETSGNRHTLYLLDRETRIVWRCIFSSAYSLPPAPGATAVRHGWPGPEG